MELVLLWGRYFFFFFFWRRESGFHEFHSNFSSSLNYVVMQDMRLVIDIAVLPSYGNRSIAITINLPQHCLDDPTVDRFDSYRWSLRFLGLFNFSNQINFTLDLFSLFAVHYITQNLYLLHSYKILFMTLFISIRVGVYLPKFTFLVRPLVNRFYHDVTSFGGFHYWMVGVKTMNNCDIFVELTFSLLKELAAIIDLFHSCTYFKSVKQMNKTEAWKGFSLTLSLALTKWEWNKKYIERPYMQFSIFTAMLYVFSEPQQNAQCIIEWPKKIWIWNT